MIRFLLKGLIRDRNRSLFPVIVVAIGVTLSILMYTFMFGFLDETVRSSAKLNTGHVKIMTKGYYEIQRQLPNDLSIDDAGTLIGELRQDYPEMEWVPRIKFGGLLDLPDEEGETRSQGPALGFAVDLLGTNSRERTRLNLKGGLVRGRLPLARGEILVSEGFAQRLEAGIGDTATLISSTKYGSIAVQNFVIVGTVTFGIGPLDRNSVIADIEDMRYTLDMSDGASEILGFFPNEVYDEAAADNIARAFNTVSAGTDDDFSLVMLPLREQNGLGEFLDMARFRLSIILFIFFLVMSIVLWNAGLMSGIRRYGEIGVRLAIGESKGQVYTSMLYESLIVGTVGFIIGSSVGLGVSFYLQEVGLDISGMVRGSSVLISNVIRAQVTPSSYFIGLIPGLVATFLGSAISGIAIFKRQTAQLFKELES
ncbi:MAG: ABC transporter permease [bacterium]|nr:MAG: ABC transporter permease [bacterium]